MTISNWKTSTGGDVEAVVTIPNPVEPAYPVVLRLRIFVDKDAGWRAHATLHADTDTHVELFRLYAPTLPEAMKRTVDGLHTIFKGLADATD